MRNKLLSILAISLLLSPIAFSQSRETGAIRGVVTDDQKSPLPGVNVTLTSRNLMGIRTFVTDLNGEFRFPVLPPGEYQVKAELQGFGTVKQENIRLNATITLTLDLQMKPAEVTEEVTVLAQSPTVDVKSTETASATLDDTLLRNIPRTNFTADLVNLAPGVIGDVAYGASESTGIAYSMDGINVADPEAGSAWVFSDHNIIDEAKVMGIGLPAEYGNFTGVIFNVVTKSGGNTFSGHFEFQYQGFRDAKPKGLWSTTNLGAYIADYPDLTAPGARLFDINGHLGGPIIKDKLWFYGGLQYYRDAYRITGFDGNLDYKQPRLFVKLTSQLTPNLNLSTVFQTTKYEGINRGASATTSPEATVNQHSPDWLVSFSLTDILSPRTFFDIKGTYFEGIYYLDPEVGGAAYMHYSYNDLMRYDSAGYYYYADRARFQTNASLTHYAEDFLAGTHEFKFGAEFERSMARSRYGYTGTGGIMGDHVRYYDYVGYGNDANDVYGYFTGPYLAYQYGGYDLNTHYTRLEAFVQDSWQVTKRLNLSLGVRFSNNWGDVKNVSGTVFHTSRLAPRLGFTFDILGDKSTILKAQYGQFTEAMLTVYHDRMNPDSAFQDNISYKWSFATSEFQEMSRTHYENLYSVDENIRHPYMTQWTVGIERELFKDASVGITYINRRWNNLIGRYDTLAEYDPVILNIPELGGDVTIYERTAETLDSHAYFITNMQKSADYPLVLEDPYRKYEGVEFIFNKRFSHRWQLLASYVYSKASGTVDNTFGSDIGWGSPDGTGIISDPNIWVNSLGTLTNDPTHMIKIQGTYVLPLDISLSASFRAITGDSWTTLYLTDYYNQGLILFMGEERGSNHYAMEKNLDLRLEKFFTLAKKYRLGVMIDVYNVFNDDTITSWGTQLGQYADWLAEGDPGYTPSTGGHSLYGIVNPRAARVGIRFIF